MRIRAYDASARGGFTILVLMIVMSATLLIIAGVLGWTATNTNLIFRNNQYFQTAAVAEAATEKVLSRIASDYQRGGESEVFANLAGYRSLVPNAAEDPLFSNYYFSNGQGHPGRTYVEFVPPGEFRVLSAQYRGLRGYASAFRIVSNARDVTTRHSIVAAVRQDIEVATIPLFQFAIFYNLDLEINPGPEMTVNGAVHCNKTIYLQPQNTLTFQGDVTAAENITMDKKAEDPSVRSAGSTAFQAEHDGGVSTLNLPIGTNNSPGTVRQVLEIPPAGEESTSPLGKQRFYNKADLIILVRDSGVTTKSGLLNNFATSIPSSEYGSFVDPNISFFNKRENKTVKAVQIDIGRLRQWNATNTLLRPLLPSSDVQIIYVADLRAQTSSTESGVRLVNAQNLLPKGLTIATPNPLYVSGHYNAPSSAIGTANTSETKPAALIGDAVTILSTAWSDSNATKGLASRRAADTTVNAAILAGIVPTTSANGYSGGVENFPRFLEDWSGRTLTYNGSMVVMFESVFATGLWRGTGTAYNIYNPPKRNWAFDLNFRDPQKLPPGTPAARALIRGSWAMIKPNTVN